MLFVVVVVVVGEVIEETGSLPTRLVLLDRPCAAAAAVKGLVLLVAAIVEFKLVPPIRPARPALLERF